MDFLLNIFSEKLAKFVVGFRKEQVTASLLTGKGEITDIHVNVEPLNAILKETTPFIELSSVYVSKLSFNVSSFTNLKKKPIEVSIDEIHVLLIEPLSFKKRSWSRDEWTKKIVTDSLKRGSYSLIDRIGDNITLEVNRTYITFQPMGSFKTRRIGPWTPPAICIAFSHLKYVSVDEFGQEGSNDEIWRHTSRSTKESNKSIPGKRFADIERISRRGTIMIFKKVSTECSVAIGYMKEGMNPEETFLSSSELLRNTQVETHIALHRKLRNASILAVQVDVSLGNVEVDIESGFLPTLIHAALGVQYCLVKDRAFTDPLICNEKISNNLEKINSPTIKILEQEAEVDQVESTVEDNDPRDDDSVSDDDISTHDFENVSSNISMEQKSGTRITGILPNSLRMKNRKPMNPTTDKSEDWPAIIMPNGTLIFEKICVGLTIHKVGLRLRRENYVEGYTQLTMKGLVSEIIWPQLKIQRGGIVQLTLAYFCLQEYTNKSLRTLLIGGTEHDWFKTTCIKETSFEELFPMLESRPIRKDLFDFRGSFPMQAFGFKASIRVIEEPSSIEDRIFVLNEVGVNGIEIIFDSDRWEWMSSFYSQGDGLYDNRWFSGDWRDHITQDILISSPKTFDVKECIQLVREKEMDKIELTSDLINLTAKITSVSVRIPAPLHKDAESSDIRLYFSESMILISSALPRSFLSDGILEESEANNEDMTTNDVPNIRFPNGLSDPCNAIQVSTDRNIRIQISLTNFSITAIPPVPLHRSLTLISSSKCTLLFSLEKGQDIVNSKSSSFFTALFLDMEMNIEFGVLLSVACTILHHIEQLHQTFSPYMPLLVTDDGKKQSSPTIIARLSIPNFDFFLWRHSAYVGSSQAKSDFNRDNYIQKLLLLHFSLADIDIGTQLVNGFTGKVEMKVNGVEHHRVFKASVGKISLSLCDSDSLMELRKPADSFDGVKKCVNIICFEKGKGSSQLSGSSENFVFATRFESRDGPSCTCYSAAVQLSSGEIILRMQTIDSFITLMRETLFEQISRFGTSKRTETLKNNSFVLQVMAFLSTLYDNESSKVTAKNNIKEKVNSLFPASIDSTLMRIRVKNLMLTVPKSSLEDTYFGFIFETTSLTAGFFRGKDPCAQQKLMLDTSSGPDGLRWRQILETTSDGFHYTISSRQKCAVMDERQNRDSGAKTIIESFILESNGQPLKWRGLLDTCISSIHDLSILDELCSSLKYFSKYSTHIKCEVSDLLSAFTSAPFSDFATRDKPEIARNSRDSPLVAMCEASFESMRSMTLLFAQIKEELLRFRNESRMCLEEKQKEIDKLRAIILKKERERLSVASLVSNQACGFLRMGGTGISGQRNVSVTNLWKYWAVLSDSHLIIHKDISELIPIDFIDLQGANLRALAGSGLKRDLKQGFVIIDSNAKKRFFLAPSNKEYEMWINALSIIIGHLGGTERPVRTKSIGDKITKETSTGILQSSQQLLDGKSGEIFEERNASYSAKDTQSQNDESTVKVRRSSIDLRGTSSPNNESKNRITNIQIAPAAYTGLRQKNLNQPNSDLADPRHTTSLQHTEVNDLGSNHDSSIRREDDSVSVDSFNLDEGDESSPKRQSKLRARMSKLGSAVKKVKISGRNTFGDSGSHHDDNSVNGELLNIDDESNTKRPSKLRERMSKLGSVVKNVKVTDRNENIDSGSKNVPDLVSVEEDNECNAFSEGNSKHRSKLSDNMSKLGSIVKNTKSADENNNIDSGSNHGSDFIPTEDDNASHESPILDEGGEGSLKRRSKLRDRMSKFGSAVKNVKITDRNTLFPNMPSTRKDDSNDVELNISRRSNPTEKPVKMKSLRPDVHQPPTISLLRSKSPLKFKRIHGVWSVKISCNLNSNSNAVSEISNKFDETSVTINQMNKTDAHSTSRITFTINLTCLQHISENSKVTEVKTLSDITDFHSAISETLYSSDHRFAAENLNLSENIIYRDVVKNHVIICGNILQGLLECHDRHQDKLIQFLCDNLSALIGCMLSNNLPEIAYDKIVEFLKLGSIIDLMTTDKIVHHPEIDAVQSTPEEKLKLTDCVHLIQNCESQLINSNYQITKLKEMASKYDSSQSFTEAPMMTPSDSTLSLGVYNEAIQEALAAVMTERDEAHVQLVASRVIHSHEIEQERKKVRLLSEKVMQFGKVWNDDSVAAAHFFLGQQKSPVKKSIGKIEKEMIQNSDAELLALCTQLSSEISSRVSAELEILRMKEVRKIEYEAENSERTALREEVQRYKDQLQKEVLRRQSAENEKQKWKESFQQLINNPVAPANDITLHR